MREVRLLVIAERELWTDGAGKYFGKVHEAGPDGARAVQISRTDFTDYDTAIAWLYSPAKANEGTAKGVRNWLKGRSEARKSTGLNRGNG